MWRVTGFVACVWLVACLWETGYCGKYCQPVVIVKKVCPEGWVKFNTSCYNFTQCTEKSTCTADESARRCEAMGGHLASVRSVAENDFIDALADVAIINIYLGGRDDVTSEGDWRWADGGPVEYARWNWGEPNDYSGREDCMIIYAEHGYSWNDVPCWSTFPEHQSGYICQRPL